MKLRTLQDLTLQVGHPGPVVQVEDVKNLLREHGLFWAAQEYPLRAKAILDVVCENDDQNTD